MFRKFVIFAALASLASAQSSSTLSGAGALPSLDTCITSCLAAGAGCASFTNVTCACTNKQYQSSVQACLTSNCTTADLQTALGLQQVQCAALSSSLAQASSTSSSAPSASSSHAAGALGLRSDSLLMVAAGVVAAVVGGGLLTL